ncbi:MAG TPA: TetR/AcrR family transcriptional regulator [Acidimicrobiia bacterium]
MSRTLLIPTVLTDEQAGRRDLVVAAATELAETGGYDAVVMKEVADRSGVALATIYRWFASKDHLLTEVLLVWGAQLSESLNADPPREGDAADRVAAALGRVIDVAGSRLLLASAVVEAVLSVERGPLDAQGDFHRLMTSWIDAALGEDEVAEREAVTEVLEHVCFSTIIGFASGRQGADYAKDQLASAARLLLR